MNFSSDINECSISSSCEQNCLNTNGSFVCSCEDGYVLNSDGQNCTGKCLYVF